jgi:hypothetical protein
MGGGGGADLLLQHKYENFMNIHNYYGNDPATNPYIDGNTSLYTNVPEFLNTNNFQSKPIILSVNIQSLNSKFENLREFILESAQKNVNIAIIAVQEIWSVRYVETVQIPGYRYFQNVRSLSKGGGGWGSIFMETYHPNLYKICR